ncbi:MAG: hypothetical protein COT90_02055 [Candidatus Diapherotrites archaeon CG10_big_fil_rev_8_21_14_0_10_31_34]|nr:MAG: hypothetical protein COT90_02055 [Candidatus Diapherotrites archaeon CG10_big_fil_rev_8_21_14_0_10_31_34]PJA17284.1 MAG: hypothetical protein COX63_02865 [Candidatus Diapherotrites archaeon CG_4_10_14_0_2_um_filter_31_5]
MFKFCPKCGKKEGNFIKGFCQDCFLQDNKLLIYPDKIQIECCKRCDKIKIQRNWIELHSFELTDFLKTKIKAKEFELQEIEFELEEAEKKNFNALIEAKGLIEGNPLMLTGVIKLQFVSSICDSCMKISSDYFEATFQLRFLDNKTDRKVILNKVENLIQEMSKKDPLSRIVKLIELKNGFDLVLSSNRSAKISSEKIAKQFNSKIIKSFSVVGVDKTGKEKRRYTYCVRI